MAPVGTVRHSKILINGSHAGHGTVLHKQEPFFQNDVYEAIHSIRQMKKRRWLMQDRRPASYSTVYEARSSDGGWETRREDHIGETDGFGVVWWNNSVRDLYSVH